VTKPRVAFFTDSYHEVNGVALTSREFAHFAEERKYPFLSVHAGPRTRSWANGPFETLELANSRAVVELDTDLLFDLLFFRHYRRVRRRLQVFRPDIVHITGPGHCGLLGAMAALRLGIPLAASWHTNLHEFAGRRLARVLRHWPLGLCRLMTDVAESASLFVTTQFYRLARVLFAPNAELVEMLNRRTGRPTHLMLRGIDTHLFSPRHRERHDSAFVIGYVGRLSPEKNIRLLAELERGLVAAGVSNYRFLVVGEGSEREWVKANLAHCEVPGTLRGEELARAYAGMDVFAFPSETDTFGNVVVEAMASGVPAIVSAHGGPKYLVEAGVSGTVAHNVEGFVNAISNLQRDPALCQRMSIGARKRALTFSWPSVFDNVYQQYDRAFAQPRCANSLRRSIKLLPNLSTFRRGFSPAALRWTSPPSACSKRQTRMVRPGKRRTR
jgi:phosphatidylinositol alpha 1,6-mannosyltransferase